MRCVRQGIRCSLEGILRPRYVKVSIALAKGKKLYDKRDTIAKNDMRRQAEKDFKSEILLYKFVVYSHFTEKA